MSTDTMRTIRDGEPRATTSTFTQLLSSELEDWRIPTFKGANLLKASLMQQVEDIKIKT